MKKLLFFIAASITMISCSLCEKKYTIIGELGRSSLNGSTVALYSLSAHKPICDTVVVDGKFEFTGSIDSDDVAFITVGSLRIPVVLEKGNIIVNVENGSVVSGTPLNEKMQKVADFNQEINRLYYTTSDSLKAVYKEDIEQFRAELTKYYENSIKDSILNMNDKFIDENKSNVLGAYLYSEFKIKDATVAEIDEFILENPYAADFETITKARLNKINAENTGEGEMFVDFTVRNIEDTEDVKLSDYVGKGNYVLVDFWASWCGPCKAEMPKLAKLKKDFDSKGLVILSVNVWDTHNAALKSISDMKMTWEQIYAPKGNEATELYGILGIPTIILFAPDGTIVSRTLRGQELVDAVTDLYK